VTVRGNVLRESGVMRVAKRRLSMSTVSRAATATVAEDGDEVVLAAVTGAGSGDDVAVAAVGSGVNVFTTCSVCGLTGEARD